MSNPIKYNTETESNALNKGNFWIGTGDVNKGPTESTGYYSGITPPDGGYTVYIHKASGGPSIQVASNDSELLRITNTIAGTSYTTVNECLNYFAGQDDKVCFNRDYEDIVTDGLVLNLDAGFTPSYPKNGTTWYDVGGSNNGTLTNGPTFNSANGGSIVFDGTNDYVSGATPTQNSSAATLEVWYKTTKDEVFPGENRLLNIGRGAFPGVSTAGISLRLRDDKVGFAARKADGSGYWDLFTGQVVTDGAWKHVIGTFDTTSLKRYENGILTQQTATGQPYLTADDGYGVGGDSKYFEGNIALVRFYNKTLSAEEVLQNYNAQKDRFGL